ncbi:MAG: hypothetical protein M1833_006303 [Piccolia ochrophora]|nr:MAG: hypothetical protein M1833_006303 [Piccolia ochrophora]
MSSYLKRYGGPILSKPLGRQLRWKTTDPSLAIPRRIPLPDLTHLALEFTPNPKPPIPQNGTTSRHFHPRYAIMLRNHRDADPNRLYTRIFMPQSQAAKKVVRSWGQRRLRVAFVEALRERGFNGAGHRVVHGEEGVGRGDRTEQGLVGTANLILLKDIVTAEHETVKRQAQLVVDKIVTLSEEGKRGPNGGKQNGNHVKRAGA